MRADLKKIVVEVIKEESLIESTETVETAKGTLISRGPDCTCLAQEGDTILFSGFSGSRFQVGGKTYLVMNQEEIFVVL